MTHFDEIDYTALAANYVNGNRSDVGTAIGASDNPAYTVLKLLRRLATDADGADADRFMRHLNSLMRLVEYHCISHDEDVIAELVAGDIDGALRILRPEGV